MHCYVSNWIFHDLFWVMNAFWGVQVCLLLPTYWLLYTLLALLLFSAAQTCWQHFYCYLWNHDYMKCWLHKFLKEQELEKSCLLERFEGYGVAGRVVDRDGRRRWVVRVVGLATLVVARRGWLGWYSWKKNKWLIQKYLHFLFFLTLQNSKSSFLFNSPLRPVICGSSSTCHFHTYLCPMTHRKLMISFQ